VAYSQFEITSRSTLIAQSKSFSWMRTARRKKLTIAGIFLLGMICGVGVVCLVLFFQARRPAPDTSRLTATFEGAAQRDLRVPEVTDTEVERVIDKPNVDGEVERIKRLAGKLGGTAVQGVGDEAGVDVLAEIPPELTHQFSDAVKDPAKEPMTPPLVPKEESKAFVAVKLKFRESKE
jgi:hypothetical protein